MAFTLSDSVDLENGLISIPSAPPMDNSTTFTIGPPHVISCIFCLEEDGALFSNKFCSCLYSFHRECITRYIKTPTYTYNCPLCRSIICIPERIYNHRNIHREIMSAYSVPANVSAERLLMEENSVRENMNINRQLISPKHMCCIMLVSTIIIVLYGTFYGLYSTWRAGK